MDRIGIPSGRGVLIYPDGCRYEGHFKQTKPTDPVTDAVEVAVLGAKRHGTGSFIWAHGPSYEGDWVDNSIHGAGIFAWPDGRIFSGSFCCNSPEKGTLQEASGTWIVSFEDEVNLLEKQELPTPKSRREMGRIPTKLWAAITCGAAESYCSRGALELSFADRVLVKSLHTSEKSFKPKERLVQHVPYGIEEDAAHEILQAFIGDADRSRTTRLQWAIIPKPPDAEGRMETEDSDPLQEMFRIAGKALPSFRVTAAGSIQPDPLAIKKFDEIMPSMVAAGRMVGAALWHGKSFEIPFARFFCRRVLEMAKKERLQAYSTESVNSQSNEIAKLHADSPFSGTFPIHLGGEAGCCGQPGTRFFPFTRFLSDFVCFYDDTIL